MAVYSYLNKEQLTNFISSYDIGNLICFNGITEGIENSNFYVKTSQNEFILTIFEKRVHEEDLPFFINIMLHLSTKGFNCPTPIIDIKNNYLQKLLGKPAIIVNYLKGKSKTKVTSENCFHVGSSMASMHLKSKDFSQRRKNSLSIIGCEELLKKCAKSIPINFLNEIEPEILNEIQNCLNYCKKFWPNNLPHGFIHGDMFPDNVFFNKNKISGIIDFYFSCTDILVYDLAIAVNAWCFDNEEDFDEEKFKSLIEGYNSKRKLDQREIFYLPLLCQAAALRFLLTRLYDWFHTSKKADVVPKDPREYITKLRHHKKIAASKNYDKISS